MSTMPRACRGRGAWPPRRPSSVGSNSNVDRKRGRVLKAFPMSRLRRLIFAGLVLLFFGASLLSQPLLIRATYAAEQTPPFTPPWGPTRERVPQEVKDKENEQPLAWCENVERGEFEVTYVDANTGTRTRIKRRVRTIRTDTGLSLIEGIDWEVTIDGGGQPKRKITYTNLQPPGTKPADNETRTEQRGRDKPTTRPIREGDLFDPAKQPPAKKSFLPDSPTRLARVNFFASDPTLPLSRENSLRQELFILLAATQERPRPSAPSTQERPALNVKLVTYGQPLENPVVHLGEDPKTTPEEFVQKPTGTPWNPGDEEGPKTVIPGTTGIPITSIPSGGINIGSGWASAQVPSSTLISCSSGDEVDELTTQARKLSELAQKAEEGGPNYWDQRAKTHEGNASRAESQHRPQLIEPELRRAKEAREIANELRSRGIPEKPDPNMKDKKNLAKLEKARRDAIQGLRDEARALRDRAQALLRE